MAMQNILKNRAILLFVILSCFFVANTIVAEFIGSKIFSFEKLLGIDPLNITLFGVSDLGLNLTAGAILWPIVFIMTDIINEYYGRKAVRFLSYLAILIVFYAFFMVYGAIGLPANDWWQFQSGLTKNQYDDHSGLHDSFRGFPAARCAHFPALQKGYRR